MFGPAPIAMCILRGPDHIVEVANDRQCEIWGRLADEVLGKPLLRAIPELREQTLAAHLADVLTHGKPFVATELPVMLVREERLAVVYFDIACAPLRDAADRLTGVMIVAVDVTAQLAARQRAEALAEENARLYRGAQEMLRRSEAYLAAASHELRTPITSLRAGTELLLIQLQRQGQVEPGKLLHILTLVDTQARRLSYMITQMLESSRLETRKLVLDLAATDLAPMLQMAVDRARLDTTRHTFVVEAPAALPAMVDSMRFEQVINNLLTNAVKYSPEGGTITVAASAPDAATIAIAVTDQGIGISSEHHAHIFERLYQVNPDGRGTGMGLGLFISHEIAQLHGGDLRVESPPAGGARFVLTLPAPSTIAAAEEAYTP